MNKKSERLLKGKRTNEDFLKLLSRKKAPIDSSFDQPGLNNEILNIREFKLHPALLNKKEFSQRDKVFLFLYNSKLIYAKFLKYVNDKQIKYGFLVIINPIDATKQLGCKLIETIRMMHHLSRKGLITLYDGGVINLKGVLISSNVIKSILRRHPDITKERPLGYRMIERYEAALSDKPID